MPHWGNSPEYQSTHRHARGRNGFKEGSRCGPSCHPTLVCGPRREQGCNRETRLWSVGPARTTERSRCDADAKRRHDCLAVRFSGFVWPRGPLLHMPLPPNPQVTHDPITGRYQSKCCADWRCCDSYCFFLSGINRCADPLCSQAQGPVLQNNASVRRALRRGVCDALDTRPRPLAHAQRLLTMVSRPAPRARRAVAGPPLRTNSLRRPSSSTVRVRPSGARTVPQALVLPRTRGGILCPAHPLPRHSSMRP